MSSSLSCDEAVAAAALRVHVRHQTPAEAGNDDEKAEPDESDTDDRRRRVDTERQSDDERHATNHRQTASNTDEHQWSGFQSA